MAGDAALCLTGGEDRGAEPEVRQSSYSAGVSPPREPEHPRTLSARANLAGAHWSLGQRDERRVQELWTRSLEDQVATLVPSSNRTPRMTSPRSRCPGRRARRASGYGAGHFSPLQARIGAAQEARRRLLLARPSLICRAALDCRVESPARHNGSNRDLASDSRRRWGSLPGNGPRASLMIEHRRRVLDCIVERVLEWGEAALLRIVAWLLWLVF